MNKAGGIVSIIAGIFGVISAVATLFLGGVSSAFETEGASMVVGLGWGGVIFSFLVIILGAVAMSASGKIPGVLIILLSIGGAVLGGTLVAVCMVLSFMGGVLTLFAKQTQTSTS